MFFPFKQHAGYFMQHLDVIKLFVIFGITWCVGLIPPIIIRYLILSRPVGKVYAIGICIVSWIAIGLVLSEALESTIQTNIALLLISLVSYWILRQGVPASQEREHKAPTERKTHRHDNITRKRFSEKKQETASSGVGGTNKQKKIAGKTSPSILKPGGDYEKDALDQEFMEFCRRGDYDRATEAAEKLYRITEKTVGPDHPDMAMRLNTLADCYKKKGRYADAEPLYRHALVIMEKVYGMDHSNVAVNLNHLADLYYAQGRYTEAEPLCNRSLAIMEKVYGPNHPDVATSLENLSALYRAVCREADAVELEQRAAVIRSNHAG